MFSKFATCVVAAAVAMLAGCAELDRKGGYVDEVQDAVFFRADTKTHRLLRSYLLATVLLTAARRQGHNDVDSTAIAGALEGALAIANEAYMCLYPGLYEAKVSNASLTYPLDPADLQLRTSTAIPGEITSWTPDGGIVWISNPLEKPRWCQFFDEKMARLDYALYRLASVTLFNSESRQALGDIQAKLVGKIPVVSDAVAAAIHANKAVNQVTTIIDDLLNLAFTSAGPALALLPLYRDSLELNMWVVTDNFALACIKKSPEFNTTKNYNLNENCTRLGEAIVILQKGNGNPKVWRDYLRQMNAEVEQDLSRTLPFEAYRPHFFLISQLLVRSCRNVLSDGLKPKRCETVLIDALEKAAFEVDNATGNLINTGTPTAGRWLTASLPLPGARLVQHRVRRVPGLGPASIAAVPKPVAPAVRDPEPTGSISRPSSTTPTAPPAR